MKSLKELPMFLKPREVADILRVSPLTIKRWTKSGYLKCLRINSRKDRRYEKEYIINFINNL